MIPLILVILAAHPSDPAAAVTEVIGHMGSCADRPGNTLAGIRRAIEAKAHVAEVDVRTTRDGVLICIHDERVDALTDGTGRVSDLTADEVRRLDAGVKFDSKFKGERVPTLREVLQVSKGRIRVMIDLKETGGDYLKRIAKEVRAHGEPKRIVLGVRSVEQAKWFAEELPESRRIGLVPELADIEPFAKAGVAAIRLWPKWLADETAVTRVRKTGVELHLGAGKGTKDEVVPLLKHAPQSLASDDPAELLKTLAALKRK